VISIRDMPTAFRIARSARTRPVDAFGAAGCVIDVCGGVHRKPTAVSLREGKILGCGMVGTHAGDMIGEVALAIEMGADAIDIGKTIHPHPTLGESIGMAAEVAHGSCTDVPPAKK
jgi:hypothetical protein